MKEQEESELLKRMKSDSSEWEGWFSLKIIEIHTCSYLPEDHSSLIAKGQDEDSISKQWLFCNVRLATVYDVKVGEAEQEGEMLTATAVAIAYCPFCGEKLL